jgi:twitching motility two-component system response regulator PilH
MPGKILIADGSPTIRNVAESLLSKHGYEVVLADDGMKTLGALKLEKPDVLFLDYSLPVLSGEQVLAELKQSRDSKPTYVIMLLDKEDEKNKRELESQGVKAFIIKPFSPKELLDKVKSLLEPKENSATKESHTSLSSTGQGKSRSGLDILETSDLVEDYEQSIPDLQKTGVHGFDWFLSELQKEITEEDKTGSEPTAKTPDRETKTTTKLEEAFVKYQPTESAPGEEPENNNPKFEGEAPENFIENLRKELEALVPEEKIVKEPVAAGMPHTTQLDQMLLDIRSKISERVAQEVTKLISSEFLERIIREEIVQFRERSNENKSTNKEDIPS